MAILQSIFLSSENVVVISLPAPCLLATLVIKKDVYYCLGRDTLELIEISVPLCVDKNGVIIYCNVLFAEGQYGFHEKWR